MPPTTTGGAGSDPATESDDDDRDAPAAASGPVLPAPAVAPVAGPPGPPASTGAHQPLHQGWWRRRSPLQRADLILRSALGLITAMMVLLGVGMWRNDMLIDDDPAYAAATVLTVNPLSTGIEFVDASGTSQRPAHGVLYPGGLTVGQQFLVEYAADDPSVARVAGRTALNGIVMPGLVIVVAWFIGVPVIWWLRRRERRIPLDLALALELNDRPRRRTWYRRR